MADDPLLVQPHMMYVGLMRLEVGEGDSQITEEEASELRALLDEGYDD